MKKGTNVGAVYVAATVDASGMNEDIVDGLDGVDEEFDKKGREHGDEYGDAFGEGMSERLRGTLSKRIGDALAEHLDKDADEAGNRVGSRLGDRVGSSLSDSDGGRKGLDSLFSDQAIDRIADRMGKRIGKRVSKRIEESIGSMEDRIDRAIRSVSGNSTSSSSLGGNTAGGRGLTDEQKLETAHQKFIFDFEESRRKMHEAANAAIDKSDHDLVKDQERLYRESLAMEDAKTKFLAKFEEARRKNHEASQAAIAKSDGDLLKYQEKLYASLAAEHEKREKAYTDYLEGEQRKRMADEEKYGRMAVETERRRAADRFKARSEYEKLWHDLIARQDDDKRFLDSQRQAQRLLSDIKFNPKIDEDSILRVTEQLRADLERSHALDLELKGDLSERERAKIEAEIRTIRGRIEVTVDEDRLNESLLRTRARVNGNDSTLGDRLGRLLGAGSRNNFLNIFGKAIGGLTNIVERGSRSVFKFSSDIVTAFKDADNAAEGFAEAGKILGGGLVSLGGSMFALIGVAVLLIPLISLLATAISGLIGIVAALAATIVSALVGALLVVGGLLGAVVIGVGATVLAFKALSAAQKTLLKDSFIPLRNEFMGLGQLLTRDLVPGLARFSTAAQRAIVPLAPMFSGVGTAIATVLDGFGAALNGSNFQFLFKTLGTDLPGIMVTFGDSVTHLSSALAGTFAVLLPFVQRFADYIDRATIKFDKFAGSAKGRKEMTDFFTRMYDAAKTFGHFLGELGGLLDDVLFGVSGNQAGATIFDSITASIARFRSYIADGGLERWFNQAVSLSKALGGMLGALGRVFDALVTDGSMAALNGLLRGISGFLGIMIPLIKGVVAAFGPLADIIGAVDHALSGIPTEAKLMVVVIPLLTFAINGLVNVLTALALRSVAAAGGLRGFATKAAGLAAIVGGFTLATQNANSNTKVFGGTLLAMAGGFAIGGPVGAGLAGGITLFSSLFKSISTATGATKTFIASLQDVSTLGGYGNAISQLDQQINDLYNSYSQEASGNSFVVGFKGIFDSDFRSAAGNLDQLNQQLPILRENLIKQGQQLGLTTDGWDQLTGSVLEAKGATVDYLTTLNQQGYQFDQTGMLLTNLNNTLIDLKGASDLDLSNSMIAQLQAQIDDIQPSKLDQINQKIAGLKFAVALDPSQKQNLLSYVQSIIDKLNDGSLTQSLTDNPINLPTAQDLQNSGATANPPKTPYVNPYIAYANSIINSGPEATAAIRNAFNSANKKIEAEIAKSTAGVGVSLNKANDAIGKAIRSATHAKTSASLTQALTETIANLRSQAQAAVAKARTDGKAMLEAARATAQNTVSSAEQAVQSAAQTLAGATTPEAVAKAKAALDKAQNDLKIAQRKARQLIRAAKAGQAELISNAQGLQGNLQAAAAIVNYQKTLTKFASPVKLNGKSFTDAAHYLAAGGKLVNATLADYAAARNLIADKITKANKKLADAIALRKDYDKSVTDAAKTFGSILTAQAKTINGVEQALTYKDITANLRDRLAKIRDFQNNLRALLAEGLSNAAYKQLVDAGVDQGGAYAQAILDGGQGAIQQVNGLTAAINNTANQLGDEASKRLYNAGVAAAQGLVHGLNSMAAQLDSAATKLGNAIARAVKKALGIKSPSRVMKDITRNVGSTLANGLDDEQKRVEAASNRLSSKIAIAPSMEVARYAAEQSRQGDTTVSGNPTTVIPELHVHTPTEDPEAVAHEVFNELTGRLP